MSNSSLNELSIYVTLKQPLKLLMFGRVLPMKYAKNLNEFALAFDPDALSGKDLDEFYYDGTMPTRMNDDYQSPIDNIYKSCLMVKQQNTHLLLGHKGCGKSTELNMLKQRLEKSGRKVAVIKCLLEADLLEVSYWDLLILLGRHLCEIAKSSGCNLPEPLLNKIEDFWKDIEITEVTSDEHDTTLTARASTGTPKILPILKLFASLSSELRFGYNKKVKIREKVEKDTAQWIGYMKELSDNIANHLDGQQPIVIFEDLDKLSPGKAWKIFNKPLSQMPFPIIYTFPISLSYDPKFAQLEAAFNKNIHVLPMIKIRTLDGSAFNQGIAVIKNIIEKRADLNLFDNDALTFLIEKTGGILRDLFHCITEAASRAENRKSTKIDMEDAKAATTLLRTSLTRKIEEKNHAMLRNIYKGKKYKSMIEDKAMLLDMMQGLVVLEYNGDRWHDLHPLIEDFLKEQGELS